MKSKPIKNPITIDMPYELFKAFIRDEVESVVESVVERQLNRRFEGATRLIKALREEMDLNDESGIDYPDKKKPATMQSNCKTAKPVKNRKKGTKIHGIKLPKIKNWGKVDSVPF